MEQLLLNILDRLRTDANPISPEELDWFVRQANRGVRDNSKHASKKKLAAYYQRVRGTDTERWSAWNIDPALERRLDQTLRVKPRRTASGVATITVITRPCTCSSNCIYCPCDLRMPKSYLHNEPACQRAEHNFFDPYLQVYTRLRALTEMGHATDKVELIVLGGTWSDYPTGYQLWFMSELFRTLNEFPSSEERVRDRYALWRSLGLQNTPDALETFAEHVQARVNAGKETYNSGFHALYGASEPHTAAARISVATEDDLLRQQRRNETAAHRVVGLVIETRPDCITPQSLTLFRKLGCTKIQVGIQSTRQEILDVNQRHTTIAQVRRAFSLIRLIGFKIHSHLMLNLLGSAPEDDKGDFATFVTDPGFLPDEIKLYPCALVPGTELVRRYEAGAWRPYTTAELLNVLVTDTLSTPPYVRISRMIRDIAAEDILVGNKHANLRQLVEEKIAEAGAAGQVKEIRFREIAGANVDLGTLALTDFPYQTAVSEEHFLQWVTPEGKIAGFCRLSLPRWDDLAAGSCDVAASELPTEPGSAMIREVHVYGQAAHLGKSDAAAQHQGLGRQLVERACSIAAAAGYERTYVISSVGTREYYRHLGFIDAGLYQMRQGDGSRVS